MTELEARGAFDDCRPGPDPGKHIEKMCLYMSGKISGNDHAFIDFFIAGNAIGEKGHAVLNPMSVPEEVSKSSSMDIRFAMIRAADGVAALDGWKESQEARMELRYAVLLGKEVFFGVDSVPEVNG